MEIIWFSVRFLVSPTGLRHFGSRWKRFSIMKNLKTRHPPIFLNGEQYNYYYNLKYKVGTRHSPPSASFSYISLVQPIIQPSCCKPLLMCKSNFYAPYVNVTHFADIPARHENFFFVWLIQIELIQWRSPLSFTWYTYKSCS